MATAATAACGPATHLAHLTVPFTPPQTGLADLTAARGFEQLIAGHYEAAVELLHRAVSADTPLLSGTTAALADFLEANRARGATGADNRAVRTVVGDVFSDRHSPRHPALLARCNGLCASTQDLDTPFTAALQLTHPDFPIDRARTQLAYARCLQLAGRRREAAPLVAEAIGTFEELGMYGLVRHARAVLTTKPSPPRWADLNEIERSILTQLLQRNT